MLSSDEREESLSARREQYMRDGYLTVSNVLSADEVSALRQTISQAFDEPPGVSDSEAQRIDMFSRYPATRGLLDHDDLLALLRSILGERLVLLPDAVAHDSNFPTWHTDTTTQAQRGYTFHEDPGFRIVSTAFYLQDNGPYGGGLDVIPGSHRRADPWVRRPKSHIGQVFDYRVLRPLRTRHAVRTPTRAGDALLFDLRLAHQATQPECPRDQIPPERRKLAAFMTWTDSTETAARYREYLVSHEQYEYLKTHSYPQDVERIAAERGIELG
jgi:Phytanoyl-CoA dioxygenase (PhyH)